MRRFATTSALVCALSATATVPADAAPRFVIRGAGYGHGVGMSQYGALGQARAGRTYQQILGHYYTGTTIGRLGGAPQVRVLLQSRATVAFTGATRAGGAALEPGETYTVVPRPAGLALRDAAGETVGTVDGPLRVTGDGPVTLTGGENSGAYRGALVLLPAGGRVDAVNHVGLEDYVRGVVSSESPASWPAEALRAQAVAARTYAVTTSKNGAGFDHYADTRSQVYDGVAAERPTTDAAVAGTAGQVVTAGGKPVVTYFFSTSGGRTENAEFGFPGGAPAAHLKSVDDPWDAVSPRHRWGPTSLTLTQAGRKLRGLVRGSFRGIRVIQRGQSPRIVKAEVLGTRGRTPVDGPTLRARFGLFDTWATFATIDTVGRVRPAPSGTGGAPVGRAAMLPRVQGAVLGSVLGVDRGAVVRVQRRVGGRAWRTETRTRIGAGGRYRAVVTRRGEFRVVVAGLPGPSVTLR
jgi:stage II sporulation protein D